MTKSISPFKARRLLLLATSATTFILVASSANAQCAPDPTQTNQATTCSGTDTDGLQVTTSGTSVIVSQGASVSSSTTPAIDVNIPAATNVFVSRTASLSIGGSIDGTSHAGVSLVSGSATGYDFYGSRLAVTVSAGGSISGANGIVVGQTTGNSSGTAIATIDNSGTITGTNGAALLSTAPAVAGFGTITNRSGGVIGAISGPVGTLNNAGTIDGGSLSALDEGTVYNSGIIAGTISNSGTIQSTTNLATIANLLSLGTITNSGVIANLGSGAAIGSASLAVTNSAQGSITSAGATAINASGNLTLTNSGQIAGNVLAGSAQSAYGSTVDSSLGTIAGSLTFGSGNDVLVALFTDHLITGVTGMIDGGAGSDTVRILFDSDTLLNAPVALPTNFEKLSIAPAAGVTTTLGEGFLATSLAISGSGLVVNRGTIQGVDTVLASELGTYSSVSNVGTIRSTSGASTTAAISFTGSNFTNSGTISAAGGGLNFSSQGTLTNTGTIEAAGTAVTLFGPRFSNSGTIRSTGGIGAVISGSTATLTTNSGLIEGLTVGVALSSGMTNSGTIQSAGLAVRLDSYGYIDNRAGAVINGGSGGAIGPSGSTIFNTYVSNAGTINGNVTIGSTCCGIYPNNNIFIAQPGGVLNGNLTLGYGDYLVTELAGSGSGHFAGITGSVTANNSYLRYRVRSDMSAVYGAATGFQSVGYELIGGAKLTLTTAGGTVAPVSFAGTGSVDITADIAGSGTPLIQSISPIADPNAPVGANALAITSRGALTLTHNSSDTYPAAAVVLGADSFQNLGTITVREQATNVYSPIAAISGGTAITNSGTISLSQAIGVRGSASLTNSGSIVQLAGTNAAIGVQDVTTITNSGTIKVDGTAISISTSGIDAAVITNSASGLISGGATAINVSRALTLTNAGTITSSGTNALAIQASISAVANVTNSGTITGSIQTGFSADTIDNSGLITGDVRLGDGNDSFIQRGSGRVTGTIDGGAGTDRFTVDSTGNATVTAGQIVNFEQLTQIGSGTATYSGTFSLPTIALTGGTLAVTSGQTLATSSATTITGGNAAVAVNNAGTIAGSVILGSAGDTVINLGRIAGSVSLGGGDDSFTEGAGSSVGGTVDGGAGTDTYRVRLAGDRSGINARTNFEQLAVEGTGTLSLTLDQDYQAVALNGAGLNLTLGGHMTGPVTGGDGADSLIVDGDVASVSLGGGNDLLSINAAQLNGRYDGGAGSDTLRITATGPVTLGGSAVGFETLTLAGQDLTITGTLGAQGETLSLSGTTDKNVTVASGGTLAGVIDLGAGNDSFTIAAGATLSGSVSGGAGNNVATVEIGSDATLGALSNFQTVRVQGSGATTFAGNSTSLGQVTVPGDATVAQGGSLAASQLVFGAGNNRFAVNGVFSGSVDGGAGTDRIDVLGGSAGAPVAFRDIVNVEAFAMSGGYATLAGTGSFQTLGLTGGRLIGLAGSTISAPQINVGAGATFGSAGTVNGNIAVAGILSPGASPGTMTVNGNVALASGSISLFEITPTVSDKLVVNGVVTIANGATLQLVPSEGVTPGVTRDLIVASGGISGSFTTVIRPASLFGTLIQQGDKLQLLGLFPGDPSYSPQVQRSIGYINTVIASGQISSGLLAALPSLAFSNGTSNVAAFAQISPEAYASARQIAVENGLTIAGVARGEGFAAPGDTTALFSFGEGLGNWRSLTDHTGGVSTAKTDGYGMVGGLGLGRHDLSVGAFVGYLNSHQRISALGTQTRADGVIAGIHGRFAHNGWMVTGMLAYDGGDATTKRSVLAQNVSSDFALHGWTGDLSVSYALSLSANWSLKPTIGGTIIRSTRRAATEQGSSPFALTLREETGTAGFLDAGFVLNGGRAAGSMLHPMASLGLRYQASDRQTDTLAGLVGTPYGLFADGSRRAAVMATGALGLDADLGERVTVFGSLVGERGEHDHRESARAGLKVRL